MYFLRHGPFVVLCWLAMTLSLPTSVCWADDPASDLAQPGVTLSLKGPEELLFEEAQKLEAKRQWIDAKFLYRKIIETGRDPYWMEKATWQLVLIAEARGEEESELRYLKETMKFPAGGGLRRTIRDEAEKKLGWFYLRHQQFAEAAAVIKEWKTGSFCGNCAVGMSMHRWSILSYCRIHLGEQRAVAEEIFRMIKQPENPYLIGRENVSPFEAYLLFEIYRSAGQMPDLLERLNHDHNLPQSVREQLEVQRLFAAQDPAGLYECCFPKPNLPTTLNPYWNGKQRAAVEAYLRLTQNDLKPFRALLTNPHASPTVAFYALGKAGTAEARDRLFDLVAERDNATDLTELAFAIHLHSPAAIELWKKQQKVNWINLAKYQETLVLERPLPKLPVGSLPK